MRLIFAVVILWLSVVNTFGQTQANRQRLCMMSLILMPGWLTLIKSPLFHINLIREELSADTLYAAGLEYYDSTKLVVLTHREKQYINQVLNRMSTVDWTEKLFVEGMLVKTDPAGGILNDQNPNGFHPERSSTDRLYSFSRPVFIRNQTLCIFCSGYSCGPRCGYGEVSVFRKISGKWSRWFKLTTWVV